MNKMANNILEFLLDPTKIPVKTRLYFRPEEILDNGIYEKAKADALTAYGTQHKNSDMYPGRKKGQTTKSGGLLMDRRTLIASLDILSQKFASDQDPIAKDLRTMAYVVANMPEEEYGSRVAKEEEEKQEVPAEEKKAEEAKDAPAEKEPEKAETPEDEAEKAEKTANAWMDLMKKVREENPGKSIAEWAAIAKKTYKPVKKEKTASEEQPADFVDCWSKEASDMVVGALLEDHGYEAAKEEPVVEEPKKDVPVEKKPEEKKEKVVEAGKIKGPGIPDGTGPMSGTPACQMKKEEEEKKEAAKKEPVEKPVEKPVVEEVPADKESKIVDTNILEAATQKIGDIEIDSLSKNVDAVELTDADHRSLDSLFSFTAVKDLTADEKDRFDQLFK